jgi:hypothetical protein
MRRSMAAVNSRAIVDNKRLGRELDDEIIRFQLTHITQHTIDKYSFIQVSTLTAYFHVTSSH